jgi:CRISPR-associated endonuclease/helicase Cas3
MSTLTFDRFDEFFQALHYREEKKESRPAYDWQKRLARRAIEGDWFKAIDLPTGGGKTACIDIAVYAMACQAARAIGERKAPRRVFFCVNRRVIVDEAHDRAKRIARRLVEAEYGDRWSEFPILGEVARALRQLAGTEDRRNEVPPLDVLELRGGIYRDNRWARSATQPTVVCTTIDQLGSRLLFRGFGVSPQAAPIQAALIAYDSLVLLDEAHISQPFLQTLQQVGRYLDPQKWADEPIGPRPMIVVPMTATPSGQIDPGDILSLEHADRENESLTNRLKASKPATLERAADVPTALVEHARNAAKDGPVAVGIIVNRVATARTIYAQLQKEHPDAGVELVIGAMRPSDRDRQAERLAELVGPGRPTPSAKTSFVVSTQCLEVGADYDFDLLLTECASLDALRQRFGRLNRAGRKIKARALIVVKEKDIKSEDAIEKETRPLDPIYGNALARTWNWLWKHASAVAPPSEVPDEGETKSRRGRRKAKGTKEMHVVDFGLDTFREFLNKHGDEGRMPAPLLAPSAKENAPVMLPAYVDFWCQTSPNPVPDPDVALFLHGTRRGEPDVQVCWRADLVEDQGMRRADWPDVVALVPPSSAECMLVPLSRMRHWLAGKDDAATDRGDLLEVAEGENGEELEAPSSDRIAVLWRGAERSKLLQTVEDLRLIRPGDTIVLPEKAAGWNELGHIPTRSPTPLEASCPGPRPGIDVAEEAFRTARDRRVLRLHPELLPTSSHTERLSALLGRIAEPEDRLSADELRQRLREAADDLSPGDPRRTLVNEFAGTSFVHKPYPDWRGIVLISRERLRSQDSWFLPALDDGEDDASRTAREELISLADHTDHVRRALDHTLRLIHTSTRQRTLLRAADWHDLGKADDRFQAMLLGSSRTDAWLSPGGGRSLWAKSDGMPMSSAERKAVRERAGLPAGFRHEMLSVQLAELEVLADITEAERDLVLHLIAAHHGYARPFAPVVIDDDPPKVENAGAALTPDDRRQRPPHRLDSGIGERFWSLTRRYGWWGLAYLEALLRLADQQASADEDAGLYEQADSTEHEEVLS